MISGDVSSRKYAGRLQMLGIEIVRKKLVQRLQFTKYYKTIVENFKKILIFLLYLGGQGGNLHFLHTIG